MDSFTPFLKQQRALVLDGGLATELERGGADLRDPLWSAKMLLEDPDLIRQVHRDYFIAGADVATTASYQANLPALMARGLSREGASAILVRSVTLAQEAREDFWAVPQNRAFRLRPLIAASVGCYGASLHDGSEYRGDYGRSVRELADWHRPRVEILAESGADLLAFETVPSLKEAEAILDLLREVPKVPAWLSFSCKDEQRLCHGEPFSQAVAMVNHGPGIVAVGVNCTAPEFVEGLLRSASGTTTKPLLAYPNAGETWDASARCWQTAGNSFHWNTGVETWWRCGARLIGGCCRTTPAIIHEIAAVLRPPGIEKPL